MTESGEYSGPLPEVVPRLEYFRRLVMASTRAFLRHNGFTSSAALAFYFLLSLLPFLIFLASALVLLPVEHLATRMIHLAAHFVPGQTMPMVQNMLTSTMDTSNGLLSAGFIFALISASNAFAVMASALNTIYSGETRESFWRSRVNAIYVTVIVGGLTVVALSAMLLGPHFGRELRRVFDVSYTFVAVWPVLRWVLAVTCALASIEALYFLGVSRKHSLRQQFPGSVFAVAVWIVSSVLLGIYFRQFAYLNAMYGTLTSFVILMIWLQLTAIAILLGAELNVQVERLRDTEQDSQPDEPTSSETSYAPSRAVSS